MQRFHYLADEVKPSLDIVPAARADNATATSDALDQLAASSQFGEAMAILHTGAASGTPDTQSVTLKLQESDDNSTWSDVTGKSVESTADSEVKTFTWKPGDYARYQQLHLEVQLTGGTTPAMPCSGIVLLGSPARGPVS